jgi:TM2 domain-containing membrane protein YozV
MSALVCPYCRTPIEPDDEIHKCSACGTVHHLECWEENGGCTVFGCANAPVEEAKITLTDGDMAGSPLDATPQFDSALTWESPGQEGVPAPQGAPGQSTAPVRQQPAAGSAPPPPPPSTAPSTGAAPPPPVNISFPQAPLPNGLEPAIASPGSILGTGAADSSPAVGATSGSYNYSPIPGTSDPPVSNADRTTFAILGFLFGWLGVHNFYAHRPWPATVQACLTVFTCGIGAPVSWIWAVVEIFVVRTDGQGYALR